MIDDSVLQVTASIAIPLTELTWRFSPSGGPGGQHANRSNTRAEVIFDAAASPALGPHQRARVVTALGPVVRVVADDERSQSRNRALALDRLAARLRSALVVQSPRRATRPTRSSQARRLDAKHQRGETKQRRRWQPDD